MDFTKLDAYIAQLPEHGIPAADIAVYRDHKLIHRFMAGCSDYEGKVPVSEQDMYHIYSNTKVLTVVAVMQLVEQGKISLEDPVSKFLPSFSALTYRKRAKILPVTKPLTIYHLLTMTSGFGYDHFGAVEAALEMNPEAGTVELASALASEPLHFQPGERWMYGMGHDILGAVVEVVSGRKFGDYLEEHILEPLDMKHTTFDFSDPYVQAHISALYNYDAKLDKTVPIENSSPAWSANMQSGGGGALSCTEDYILLMDALANEGVGKTGNRILRKETIDLIRTPQLDLLKQSQFLISHMKKGYSYGLGVRTLIDKGYSRSPIGEFAWDGLTGGYGLADPDNKIAICYMQNVENCLYAYREVFFRTRDLIYEALGIE